MAGPNWPEKSDHQEVLEQNKKDLKESFKWFEEMSASKQELISSLPIKKNKWERITSESIGKAMESDLDSRIMKAGFWTGSEKELWAKKKEIMDALNAEKDPLKKMEMYAWLVEWLENRMGTEFAEKKRGEQDIQASENEQKSQLEKTAEWFGKKWSELRKHMDQLIEQNNKKERKTISEASAKNQSEAEKSSSKANSEADEKLREQFP